MLQSIEELREELYQVAKAKGLHHPDVLYASQYLDMALNQYYHGESKQDCL